MEYYEALQKLVNNDDFTKSLNFTVIFSLNPGAETWSTMLSVWGLEVA